MFDKIERLLKGSIADATCSCHCIEWRYVGAHAISIALATLQVRADMRCQLDVVVKNYIANITLKKR